MLYTGLMYAADGAPYNADAVSGVGYVPPDTGPGQPPPSWATPIPAGRPGRNSTYAWRSIVQRGVTGKQRA
jgi:hypothetical protein